jgi:hypothetical protein
LRHVRRLGIDGRECKAAIRLQPAPDTPDDRGVERHVLGEDADRIHEIEAVVRKGVRRQIALHQAELARGDAVRANGVTRFGEHGCRRVEADERASIVDAPEIASGTAAQIEHVDPMVESAAHLLQPGDGILVGPLLEQRFIAIPVLARIRVVIERLGLARPRTDRFAGGHHQFGWNNCSTVTKRTSSKPAA